MCGLTGFWTPDRLPERLDVVAQRMAGTLTHRGPDDAGVWVDEGVGLALAHRRLAILDLSPAGHQPMVSASGRYVVAFNGEIYNHLELRKALTPGPSPRGRGGYWRGHSDTETLLAAFEAWGVEGALKKTFGMFAIALWDRATHTLTLARDRMGEKPLYYGWVRGTLVFGSELKAIRAFPGFGNAIERRALALFVRHNYVPAPWSIYEGIWKLPPGCYVQFLASAPASGFQPLSQGESRVTLTPSPSPRGRGEWLSPPTTLPGGEGCGSHPQPLSWGERGAYYIPLSRQRERGRGEGGGVPTELREFARKLRREATDAERLMWYLLRDRRLAGRKFRRQHPVPPYVLDFYCPELRLAIELDGGQHAERRTRDARRDAFLAERGIRVLRFWNDDVLARTEAVLERIWGEVCPSPPTPLPEGEECGPHPQPLSQRERDIAPTPHPSPAGGRGVRGEGGAALPHCLGAFPTPGSTGKVTPYWSLREAAEAGLREPFMGTEDEAVDELNRLLRQSLAGQMIADVPLGAFLSGGVDSSTVVAVMQAMSSQPMKTFTIGFHEGEYNEAKHAHAVARHLGTEHTEWYVTPQDALNVIPKLPTLFDEPFADSSQIPTHLVSMLARRHVTVSLSGDGGDELFGGYNRYFWAMRLWRKLSALPLPLRRAAAGMVRALSPAIWNRIFGVAAPLLPERYRFTLPGDKLYKAAALFSAARPEEIYLRLVSHWEDPAAVVLGAEEPATPLTDSGAWLDCPDFEQRMMYLDSITYLPDDILVKVDRAAMGVSLETRVPLLDHRIVEFAWRLPLSLKIRKGQGKWLLRQVLYQYVPRELIERPKMGFGVPIDHWLRGPLKSWAEDLLEEGRLTREGFFDPAPIRLKWAEHLSDRRNWAYHLWDVLMFQAWLEATRA